MSLNERQFDWDLVGDKRTFHGTRAEIPGKTLKPSAATGKENYDYDAFRDGSTRRNNVFFTTPVDHLSGNPEESPEARAWQWASTGTHNRKGRPRVYEVQPRGEVQRDSIATGAAMAPSARIKNRIDIPPDAAARNLGHSENWERVPGGVQGTLPMTDWDTHVDRNRRSENQAEAMHQEGKRVLEKYAPMKRNPDQGTLFNDRRLRPKDWYEDEHE